MNKKQTKKSKTNPSNMATKTRKHSNKSNPNECLDELSSIENPSLKDVMQAILTSNMNINTKIDNLSQTMQAKIDDVNVKVESIKQDVTGNSKAICCLNDNAEECVKRITELEYQNEYVLQQSWRNDVVIFGVPCDIQNYEQVITDIGAILNFTLDDIGNHFKKGIAVQNNNMRHKDNNCQIVLCFKFINKKLETIKKLIANGPIFLQQIIPNSSPSKKIVINHRLRKHFSSLLSRSKKIQRDGKLFKTWFNGHIFIQGKHDDTPVVLKCSSQLQQFNV